MDFITRQDNIVPVMLVPSVPFFMNEFKKTRLTTSHDCTQGKTLMARGKGPIKVFDGWIQTVWSILFEGFIHSKIIRQQLFSNSSSFPHFFLAYAVPRFRKWPCRRRKFQKIRAESQLFLATFMPHVDSYRYALRSYCLRRGLKPRGIVSCTGIGVLNEDVSSQSPPARESGTTRTNSKMMFAHQESGNVDFWNKE